MRGENLCVLNKNNLNAILLNFKCQTPHVAAVCIPGGPKITEQSIFLGLCSIQLLSFFTLLDKASFSRYNNTKIIKFGWKLFIPWVFSYGLSFSGFAIKFSLVGGPSKNGTFNFLGLCSNQQLSFLPCWIEHLSLIIITLRSSNLVENFLFYE